MRRRGLILLFFPPLHGQSVLPFLRIHWPKITVFLQDRVFQYDLERSVSTILLLEIFFHYDSRLNLSGL